MKYKQIGILVIAFFTLGSCAPKDSSNNVVDIKDALKQLNSYVHIDTIYSDGYVRYLNSSDQTGEYIFEHEKYKDCLYTDYGMNDSLYVVKLKKSLSKFATIDYLDTLQIRENLIFAFNRNSIDTNAVKEIGAFNISTVEYWDNYAVFYTGIWCGNHRNGYIVIMEKIDNKYRIVNVCQGWGTDPIKTMRLHN
jgi:hypothetical protein